MQMKEKKWNRNMDHDFCNELRMVDAGGRFGYRRYSGYFLISSWGCLYGRETHPHRISFFHHDDDGEHTPWVNIVYDDTEYLGGNSYEMAFSRSRSKRDQNKKKEDW